VSGTTQPAVSTTKRPATTQAPTTPTTAAAQGQLPDGWRAFTNRAGNNRVGVPPGFRVRTRQTPAVNLAVAWLALWGQTELPRRARGVWVGAVQAEALSWSAGWAVGPWCLAGS
jgi:hypothetical protein